MLILSNCFNAPLQVHSLDKCQTLCGEASIKCATFAFNRKTGDCLLSTTNINKNDRFAYITQPNPNFDLYGYLGDACAYNEAKSSSSNPQVITTTGISTHLSSAPPTTNPISELTAAMFLSDPFDEETGSTLSTRPTPITVSELTSPPLLREPKLEPIFDVDSEQKQITRQLPVFTTPSQITRKTTSTITTEKSTAPLETVITSTSRILPHRNKNMQKIPTSSIKVKAICLETGVNVTFNIENNTYTGAVYGAERFSQCRVFVDSKNEFSIFLTRPSINNMCNAIEEEVKKTFKL